MPKRSNRLAHRPARATLTLMVTLVLATAGLGVASAQTPEDPARPGNVQVFLGNPAQPGNYSRGQLLGVPGTPIRVVTGDFNGDGKRDVMVSECDDTGCRLQMFPSTDPGAFGAPTAFPLPMRPGPMAAANLNGDGGDDLVLTFPQPELESFEPRAVLVYLAPNFATPFRALQCECGLIRDVAIGNLTPDPFPDWVVSGQEGTAVFRHLPGADISAAPFKPSTGVTTAAIARSAADQWNQTPDVYVVSGPDVGGLGAVNVLIDTSDQGAFETETTNGAFGIETESDTPEAVVFDLNGDGFEDIVAILGGGSALALGMGNDSGYSYGPDFLVPTGPSPYRILMARLAPNAPTSVLVGHGNASFTAHRNTSQRGGPATFDAITTGCDAGPGLDVAVGDLNGDGADDVVYAGCYKAPPPTPTPTR